MNPDKIIGFFLGGLVGDVVGSHVEGKTKEEIKKYDLINITSKRYTDDTEMSVVLTRHLLKNKGDVNSFNLHTEFSVEAQANGFRGYTEATRNLFIGFLSGKPYKKKSTANGCLMRIGVLGLFDREDAMLINNIKKSIEYTHGSFQENVICCFIHCKVLDCILKGIDDKNNILYSILDSSKRCGNLYLRIIKRKTSTLNLQVLQISFRSNVWIYLHVPITTSSNIGILPKMQSLTVLEVEETLTPLLK